jgi:mRNA-degrading endonuclease toxin of MazEF toxin-antitoxin module
LFKVKNFNNWNLLKQKLERNKKIKFFKEREVWWCYTGLNLGHEENGKGEEFLRPTLILKKYNKNSFLGCAFSNKTKNNKYYLRIRIKNKISYLILSQIKFYSSKRLKYKIAKINNEYFKIIKKKITQVNFE